MSKIPLREGLLTERTDGDLVGFRCKSCDHFLPPLTITCPYCYSDDLEKRPLSRRGKLYTYSTNYMDSEHLKAPFNTGYIELPEGFRIFSVLKEKEGKPFEVDMEMEMVIEKLWDKDDDEVIGYKFQPV
jgi:uncharacterized OB-fold protein